MAGRDGGDGRVGQDRLALCSRITQRAERHEGDVAYRTLVDNGQAVAVGEVEEVLHADDFGNFQGPQQVAAGDVTDPDATNQSVVSRLHEHGELVNEKRVGHIVVHDAQIDRGELLHTQSRQVFFDVGAQLGGIVVGQ